MGFSFRKLIGINSYLENEREYKFSFVRKSAQALIRTSLRAIRFRKKQMKEKIKKVAENIYELPKEGEMAVPGKLFISEKLFEKVEENCVRQIANVAMMPGIVDYSIAMPDLHSGYGMSIGGVAAFDIKKGVISPGAVGYDINCGVRLLRTGMKREDFIGKRAKILKEFDRAVPSGVGRGSEFKLSDSDMMDVLNKGSKWALAKGFATPADVEHTEDYGCVEGADASKVSMKAVGRGRNQLGSLGSGNHFLEVQFVEEIYDAKVAKVFGLVKGEIVILIHCGSRGLGHQTASDYINKMEKEFGSKDLPNRELIAAPIESELGKDYRAAMGAAANFAFCNRQVITHQIRKVFDNVFGVRVEVVYDITHNMAKFEEFIIKGKKKMLCVHRKGATRSFGPGRVEICKDYRKVGQPIFIPGSMGTYSYVLVGTEEARGLSFASTAHGAGRGMSRTFAKANLVASEVKRELEEHGVLIKAGSEKGIVDEAPAAYKDVNEVVRVSDELGIGRKVVRLRPLLVVKG